MKMNHYLNVPGLLRRFAKIGLALLLVLSVAFGAGAQDVSPARVSGTVVSRACRSSGPEWSSGEPRLAP